MGGTESKAIFLWQRTPNHDILGRTKPGTGDEMTDDVLREEIIRQYLRNDRLKLKVFDSITSTNTVLKAMAEEGAEEGLCLIAGEQTAGRGRLGRSFFSPPDSGLYMSLLLRPNLQAAEATSVTACAAVAVAKAIESLAPVKAEIKWVNDVFVDGRKACGILTEASVDGESGQVNYLVVGIGINVSVPIGGFPEELGSIAGPAFGPESIPELRSRLAAEVLDRLTEYSSHLQKKECFEEYKRRSMVLGKRINILSPGKEPELATALDLAPDFALIVRIESGEIRRLNSGEVSIRPEAQ